jgi:hypothetical protein
VLVRTISVALLLLPAFPAGAASDYSNPYGEWRGQAQFHARIGADDDPTAHSVSDFSLTIDSDGKVVGSSNGTGCHALGLAVPSGPKTVINLDVTFSGCTYAGYNRRFTGNLFVYPKDSYASLRLRAYLAGSGAKSSSYDVRATLKR